MSMKCLHHLSFGVTDLEAAERFTSDWGLLDVVRTENRIVKRTAGNDAYCYIAERSERPEFRGLAFLADGLDDLRRLVDEAGASPIRQLEEPGGGCAVTLFDPDGIRIDVLAGVAEAAPKPAPAPDLVLNSPLARRRLDEPQSFRPLGPAHLYRLGHVGLRSANVARSRDWYAGTLGLITSELLEVDAKTLAAAFLRLDRGAEHVDHHCLALFGMGGPGYHHSSYELQDYQAQFMAHRWLESRGWQHNWGVGRHPGGSHVFDMWFAPDRFRFETFTDTDMLSAGVPAHVGHIMNAQMDLWRADPPDRYFEP
jgi:catechol 2,3-dioxygenase-like lactoylglutathione lyase family enzyme